MWVKICGTTNLDDALLSARLGADAIGFVFAPSPRQVTAEQAAVISSHLPRHIERVGVFPAWSPPAIVAAAHQAKLTAVQLHGVFNMELVSSLRRTLKPEIKLIQALHWETGTEDFKENAIGEKLQSILDSGALDHILVDSQVGKATGGTGVPFDWNAARTLFSLYPQLILAGGLKPQNVRKAIEKLCPWGVDVSSGVEAVAGKKDPTKLEQFITEARRA